jgi:hypothetical protein
MHHLFHFETKKKQFVQNRAVAVCDWYHFNLPIQLVRTPLEPKNEHKMTLRYSEELISSTTNFYYYE